MSFRMQMRQFSPGMKKGQDGENYMRAFYVWYEKDQLRSNDVLLNFA